MPGKRLASVQLDFAIDAKLQRTRRKVDNRRIIGKCLTTGQCGTISIRDGSLNSCAVVRYTITNCTIVLDISVNSVV